MNKAPQFSDFSVPPGLFPERASQLLENDIFRALRFFQGEDETSVVSQVEKALDSFESIMEISSTEAVQAALADFKPQKRLNTDALEPVNEDRPLRLLLLDEHGVKSSLWKEKSIAEKLSNDAVNTAKTYASMALCLFLHAKRIAEAEKDRFGQNYDPVSSLGRAFSILHWMQEMLNIAETSLSEITAIKNTESAKAQRHKSQASKGGKEANKKYTPLKEKVIRLHDERFAEKTAKGKYLATNIATAEAIYELLMDEVDATLDTADPVATIRNWISELRTSRKRNK